MKKPEAVLPEAEVEDSEPASGAASPKEKAVPARKRPAASEDIGPKKKVCSVQPSKPLDPKEWVWEDHQDEKGNPYRVSSHEDWKAGLCNVCISFTKIKGKTRSIEHSPGARVCSS